MASAIATGMAYARTPFDGAWSVVIMTSRGNCDSGFRTSVAILDGVVRSAGIGLEVSGRVTNGGQVAVRVVSGNQSANGRGRLSGNSGAGTWQGRGSAGACGGRWSAGRT